jgi:hypothetical protein
MVAIYARLHENIQGTFNDAGLEIMSPLCSALRDGNRPAMPEAASSSPDSRRGSRIEGLPAIFGKAG